LAVFFLLQFGKMAAYLECRLLYVVSNDSSCDCEQVITDNTGSADNHSPLHHAFLKTFTETLFDHALTELLPVYGAHKHLPYPRFSSRLPVTDTNDFFQPPPRN
jgi:hypothetical protein